jgi:multiple sugar transport system permease protein
MIFPFVWMIATSFQSSQESLSSTPVWLPQRLNPTNWKAAWLLGQSNGGSSWWGGLGTGYAVSFDLRFRLNSSIHQDFVAQLTDTFDNSTNMFGQSSAIKDARVVKVFQWIDHSQKLLIRRVQIHNRGTKFYETVGLKVIVPKNLYFVSSTLPPDSRSRTDVGTVLEWNNIAPGLLGYVLENYRSALKTQTLFGRYFLNSLITALSQVVFGLLVCSMAAFAFARIEFRGRDALFAIILSSLVIPGEMLLVPNFVTVFRFGWTDSYPGLIVPWVSSVFGIFLLRQFFLSLPAELFEAARIDGAGYGTQFVRLGLPLAVPGLITYGIFAFLGSWNSLLWPLIITNKPEMRTLQVGLQAFIGEAGVNYGQLMAASIMVVAPIMVGFLIAQKQFIAGVARSGLK